MNLSLQESIALFQSIHTALDSSIAAAIHPLLTAQGKLHDRGVSVLIAPSTLALCGVQQETLKQLPSMEVASQDVHFEDEGAFTGKVSASMLARSGIKFCLVGHSETRKYFHETNLSVQKKVLQLQKHGVLPIICVGETLEQREAGEMESILVEQLNRAVEKADLSHPCHMHLVESMQDRRQLHHPKDHLSHHWPQKKR